MDRVALLTMIVDEYGPLMDAASIGRDDTASGVAPSLDRVGVIVAQYPGLVDDLVEHTARYFVLDRIVKRLGANMNVGTQSGSYSLRQQYENARALRDDELRIVGPVVGATSVDQGALSTGRDVIVVTPFLSGPDPYEGEF